MKFVFIFFSGLLLILASSASSNNDDVLSNVFTFTSFKVSSTKLSPYDWRYVRVELPPFYSSTSIVINSDVSLDPKPIQEYPKRKLPMVCFREGGPPLPDVSDGLVLNGLNESAGGIQHLGNIDRCYVLQKSITFMLTCEQTPPGVYYFALFNGLGPIRTQSKMINRGSSYTASANVTVEGCSSLTVWGRHCNQTVIAPKCVNVHSQKSRVTRIIECGNFSVPSCRNLHEPEIKSVKVQGITDDLVVWGGNVGSNKATKTSDLSVMCYARLNAIPSETVFDHYSDISIMPLIIHYPKVGKWYFKLQTVYRPIGDNRVQENNMEICYSVDWALYDCPRGKTGPNCSWERHVLQAVPTTKSTVPVIFMPKIANLSHGSTNFSVEPLLSRSSHTDDFGFVWTYFVVNTSEGAAGKSIHIRFTSDKADFYALFIRFGGLPFTDSWDYFYLNKTLRISSSNHSIFKLYDTDGQNISIYMLYAREGPWTVGLRNPVFIHSSRLPHSTMSISLEGCPNQCSNHGICQSYETAGGSTSYSCCSCDRNHGGFDCSIDVVSQQGRRWQYICLIISNAAALLPAFWALWKKAWAESVIFMASGVLSAIYHACDVGWWCALHFGVLQFMDFWLSFMAVVSVFVYLVIISEAAKRTIHTIVAITTALIAAIDPTRATNIALVVAAAVVALIVGCLQEFFYTKRASLSSNPENCHNFFWRRQNIKEQVVNLTKRLWGHYRWSCLLLGLVVLSMAAITWKVQTNETYWFWHSLWHAAIYIAAFLFLCSKAKDIENPYGRHATYEFAWLNASR